MIKAFCREKSFLEAAANGHSDVWPWAEIKFFTNNRAWAKFYRDGKKVYECNSDYAKANFIIQVRGKKV